MEENDAVLAELLHAADEDARCRALDSVVRKGAPVVDAVLRRYSRTFSARNELEDVRANVMLRLVRRLNEVTRGQAVVRRFNDFVATLAFNAANDLLREHFPLRTRLKNRIRYVLSRETALDTWMHASGIAAGFPAWNGRAPLPACPPAIVPRGVLEAAIVAVLEGTGGPVLLDDLVEAVAAAWGIAEVSITTEADVPVQPANVALEQRHELAAIWNEIRTLPEKQRSALLLNLRDPQSGSAIELLVLTGTASIDDLAEALSMTPEELAEIWNDLPLDDQTIASRLGVQRQQVINLRRAARERLLRRKTRFR